MRRNQYSVEQIIAILKQHEGGRPAKKLGRQYRPLTHPPQDGQSPLCAPKCTSRMRPRESLEVKGPLVAKTGVGQVADDEGTWEAGQAARGAGVRGTPLAHSKQRHGPGAVVSCRLG